MRYFVVADITQNSDKLKPVTSAELANLGLDANILPSDHKRSKEEKKRFDKISRDKVSCAHRAIIHAMNEVENKSDFTTTELHMNGRTLELLWEYSGGDGQGLMDKSDYDQKYQWACVPIIVKPNMLNNKVVAISVSP